MRGLRGVRDGGKRLISFTESASSLKVVSVLGKSQDCARWMLSRLVTQALVCISISFFLSDAL